MTNNLSKNHNFGKNTIFLILSKLFYIGASFIFYILLVQVFDRDEINTFGLAISFNSLFIIIVDFGITEVVIRSSSKCSRNNLMSIFITGMMCKIVYALLWYAILYIIVHYLYSDGLIRHAIYIACFSALIRSFSEYIEGIATGIDKSEIVAGFTFIQYAVLLFLSILVGIIFRWGIIAVLYSYVAVMIIFLFMRLLWFFHCTDIVINTTVFARSLKKIIQESPKFGIAMITATINGAHLYLIIISIIDKTSNELAIFQGGQKVLGLLHILGGMIGRSFYAASSQAFALDNNEIIRDLLQKATHYLAVISFGTLVMFTIMGREIADIIYMGNLQGAGWILIVLSFSIPFALFQYIPCAILPAINKQGIVTVILFIMGIIGWPMTYWATNSCGINGTAFVYIFLSFVQVALLLIAQKLCTGYWIPFNELGKIISAASIMGILLLLIKALLPSWLTCFIGFIIYVYLLILLEAVKFDTKFYSLTKNMKYFNRLSG